LPISSFAAATIAYCHISQCLDPPPLGGESLPNHPANYIDGHALSLGWVDREERAVSSFLGGVPYREGSIPYPKALTMRTTSRGHKRKGVRQIGPQW
ncbi:unnamed protein product, partial [Urochloa humidicola]